MRHRVNPGARCYGPGMTLRTLLVFRRSLLSAIALAVLSVFWQASAHLDRTPGAQAREAQVSDTPHRSAVARELRSVRTSGDAPALRSLMQPMAPSHGSSKPIASGHVRRAGV